MKTLRNLSLIFSPIPAALIAAYVLKRSGVSNNLLYTALLIGALILTITNTVIVIIQLSKNS